MFTRSRRSIGTLIGTLLAMAAASAAWATPTIRSFATADIAYSSSQTLPTTGWRPIALPAISVTRAALADGVDPPVAWVRFRFDRRSLATGPIALTATGMRERYTVIFNGVPLYRSDSVAISPDFGWQYPLYADLASALVRDGTNEVAFRIETNKRRPLGVGRVSVGAAAQLRPVHNRQTYLDIVAPQIINGVLAMLSIGALLCWLVRPKEAIFGALALVGAVWWFRNLHYYVTWVPIDVDLFWTMTTDTLFAMLAVVYGFAATFLRIPHRRRMIIAIIIGCVIGGLARHLLVADGRSDSLSFLMTIPIVLATLTLLARACWRLPTTENILMLGAVVLATFAGFHDLGVAKLMWGGFGTFMQPFGSLLVFAAFGFALGRRMLEALTLVENVNTSLEIGISDATKKLVASEKSVRKLEIASAVEGERERLMREIHDGIGSSLITALAVAERQHASAGTIGTLKRSITDLRLAVDSLEPIDGDVVMLLASFRCRVERDLRDAGVVFVWQVAPCPPLPWLDAIGALHILRILQEAVGNVLVHAQAKRISVNCAISGYDETLGIIIEICDDGKGFDPEMNTPGRGLGNIRARVEALSGKLSCSSVIGSGTRIAIWLPALSRAV